MAGNSFGHILKLTSFGESHGEALGGIIDGCPAGLPIDIEIIQNELNRRKPGQSKIVTPRKEGDVVNFLSGIFEGKSTGTPIGFVIYNENERSRDYDHIKDKYRPSHADFTYQEKYGIRDYRGGGRSSARETVARVVAGAIAKIFIQQHNIEVFSYVSQVGKVSLTAPYQELDLKKIDDNIVRCPHPEIAREMIAEIEKVKHTGDTIGGCISTVIKNVPVGLGEPVFDKLHADLGKAMLSINAVKGFEYGSGFEGVKMRGSAHNDVFESKKGEVSTLTNHSGGIQGGISNGEDIYFKVAFKPVATIMQKQQSINQAGEEVSLHGKGRHDPCVLPRAVPIVDAMAALVIADHLLMNKLSKI